MTRKDFFILARTINRRYRAAVILDQPVERGLLDALITDLCDTLHLAYPRFDTARFRRACKEV
jgi:hypothetical protein